MDIMYRDLLKMKKLSLNDTTVNSGGRLYMYNNMLLKILRDTYFYADEIEKNIDFLISHSIPNTPKVYDKVFVNGFFEGYLMECIKKSFTFKESLCKKMIFDEKYFVILDIYKAIHALHEQNICIGDIHLDNFLISRDGHGYIIDLDEMVFPGNEGKFDEKYHIKLNHDSHSLVRSSFYNDNIKAFICSLSLLLNCNLEDLIVDYSIDLETIYEKYFNLLKVLKVDQYIEKLMSREKFMYFDNFLLQQYGDYVSKPKAKLFKRW